MGVDARVIVRIKQEEKPTDEQLARWSWELCRSVGAKHFFINDGLPHEQYEAAAKAWHAAFNAHPLSSQWQADRSKHNQILTDIGKPPEELRRAIILTRDYSDEEDGRVGDGKIYFQDADPIRAADGEWLLSVSLWTRYYGIGYGRGDLMTILAVAAWFETNIPGCEVWYGGDSSGCEAEPLTMELRGKLVRHLMSSAGRDYFDHARGAKHPTPAPCGLCIPGEPRFNRHGFGNDYVAVNCGGCGKSFESRDNGKTWSETKD